MFSDCEHWILVSGDDQELVAKRIAEKENEISSGRGRYARRGNNQVIKREQAIACGLRGEIALGRYAGLEWFNEHGLGNNLNGDLEFGIECKSIDWTKGNLGCTQTCLDQYLKRSPHVPLVLAVTDAWPFVEFWGFLYAREISKYPFIKPDTNYNAGFMVPRDKLRSMDEFKKLIDHWRNLRK
jgi:hypothetical protein